MHTPVLLFLLVATIRAHQPCPIPSQPPVWGGIRAFAFTQARTNERWTQTTTTMAVSFSLSRTVGASRADAQLKGGGGMGEAASNPGVGAEGRELEACGPETTLYLGEVR